VATSLRRAVAADAPAIRSLTRDAYAKWVPLIGCEPWPMIADYDVAVLNHLIDLLTVDREPVALVEMIDQPDCLLVENLAVAPAHQSRGYERLLMRHAEQVATGMGHRILRLYTNQRFIENIALYRWLGYQIDHEEVVGATVVVHMSKMI
jgi:GNAT superfamily N-acetyltransferase